MPIRDPAVDVPVPLTKTKLPPVAAVPVAFAAWTVSAWAVALLVVLSACLRVGADEPDAHDIIAAVVAREQVPPDPSMPNTVPDEVVPPSLRKDN